MSKKTTHEKNDKSEIDENIDEKKEGNIDETIDDKDNQINELTNLLKRIQAEFSNYMKRNDEEKKLYVKNASKDIILKLIPIIDHFDIALKNTSSNEEFVKGIEMIYSQLKSILENEGLKHINNLEKFDPNLHEAVLVEETDKENGIILEELRKGYTLNGIVLRHSLVKVSKNIKKNNEIINNKTNDD
jgi:molecular chaperone GrpE